MEVGRYVGDAAANGNRFCQIKPTTRTSVRRLLKISIGNEAAESSG